VRGDTARQSAASVVSIVVAALARCAVGVGQAAAPGDDRAPDPRCRTAATVQVDRAADDRAVGRLVAPQVNVGGSADRLHRRQASPNKIGSVLVATARANDSASATESPVWLRPPGPLSLISDVMAAASAVRGVPA
jgi:hypothetical protein